ncbi:DUF221-domain-containing protein [Mycena venus]|uniref:DUF221-domain-containing protein n=1 Tax=Mycena venus TaxID=2733690 RepID=A0A8H6X4Z1_9AGAR|nr:DUF221-domain-containing protein [Mycena venus]
MSVTAEEAHASNTKSFLTALVANGGLLVAEVASFLMLRNCLARIYSPRTFLPPPHKRARKLPESWWRWLPVLLGQSPKDIIHMNGLDAYMVLRFLKMLIWIFLVFTIATFLVIIPVDVVGIPPSGQDLLQRLTWTNIPSDNKHRHRFWAHILVIYLLTFYVLFMIHHEMIHFLDIRHGFLISKSYSQLSRSRTVLITDVPEELRNEHELRLFTSFIPGGIDRVWIHRETKNMSRMVERRESICNKLETAEVKVLKLATRAWRTEERKQRNRDVEQGGSLVNLPAVSLQDVLQELVPEVARPTHRTGFLGLLGKKVDTILWCTGEISRLNRDLVAARHWGACSCSMCQLPSETAHKDIVWKNLNRGGLRSTARRLHRDSQQHSYDMSECTLASLGLHSPIPGLVEGVLPPLLLATLFSMLPMMLRGLAWYECIPKHSLVSISVYRRFFLFLLVHGFLIVMISSSLTELIQDIIDQPTQTVQKIAQMLPSASVFFLTYMLTQGLAGAGAAMAQFYPLIIHFIHKWLLLRTPRQAFGVSFLMPSADFALILPRLSLLATIGFAYSVLNPVVDLFALLSYSMFYLAFKLLLTQVYDQRAEDETGGMYFPMAISNLFIGLYIAQICLASLFFLKASVSSVSFIAMGLLMLVLISLTGLAHFLLSRRFERTISKLFLACY